MQIEKSSFQIEAGSPDTFSVRDQLIQSLKTSKEYRHAFVGETIRSSLAAQIKAMRERMPSMTQKKFGELLGKSQPWVARLEDPNAALPTLSTLLSVARACDVDLQVRFAPFSEFIDWASGIAHFVPGLSPETLLVPDFDHDPGLIEHLELVTTTVIVPLAEEGIHKVTNVYEFPSGKSLERNALVDCGEMRTA